MRAGIRRRLMQSFFLASGIIGFVVILITLSVTVVVNTIADSYKSNSVLNEYSELLSQTEQSLEAYMSLRTYETINNYYNNRAKLDMRSMNFNRYPSENILLHKEFTVLQFARSFLKYADDAVYAWRADNINEASLSYNHALKSYSFLRDKVSELNTLYFNTNIERYNTLLITVKKISAGSIVIIVSVIVLNILLVYFLVSAITKPLIEISVVANRLAERDFDIPLFTYNKKNEIGNICRAFNRMIISIREYIDTIWEKAISENELREKEMRMASLYQEARLNALQTQIHPHFLFNTLNTGAQLAMMEGSDKTCSFLEQVADFYRYNLQQTGQDASLEDELHLIDSYIYIMKVRFGDKFDFITDIQYGNLEIRIPGMTLQPLVENCIKHGLVDVMHGGKITLSVFEKDKEVYITVSDNGCGFPDDVKCNLMEKETVNKQVSVANDISRGVGLSNVISRLRMYYKRDNVFSIEDGEDGGTIFTIRITDVYNTIDR